MLILESTIYIYILNPFWVSKIVQTVPQQEQKPQLKENQNYSQDITALNDNSQSLPSIIKIAPSQKNSILRPKESDSSLVYNIIKPNYSYVIQIYLII